MDIKPNGGRVKNSEGGNLNFSGYLSVAGGAGRSAREKVPSAINPSKPTNVSLGKRRASRVEGWTREWTTCWRMRQEGAVFLPRLVSNML